MASIPTKEDVVLGGGSFSTCLERAIRRPPSAVPQSTADDPLHQDWSSHHASYNLLQECLAFFSRRRHAVRLALRDANSDNSLSEGQLTAIIREYAQNKAPLLSDDVIMEYASQRALGKTPPRGYPSSSDDSRRRNIFTRSPLFCSNRGTCFDDSYNADGLESPPSPPSSPLYCEMTSSSRPVRARTSLARGTSLSAAILLTEAEIIDRLSFVERSELSALLDSELERAATFYRHRLAELAPPREDGEILPTKFTTTASSAGDEDRMKQDGGISRANQEFKDLLAHNDGNYYNDDDDDDIVEPSSNGNYRTVIDNISFNDLGSEILELHAFITTNIIVVRQILIRYDAFVRSLGGSPMSSWYQKSRRQRGKHGRTSDYRDLVFHSKLKRLTKAYVSEYKSNLENDDEDDGEEGFLGGTVGGGLGMRKRGRRRTRRFRGFAFQFHKLVDAAEEMKKRQRLKWRQPAMNASAMDMNEGFSSSMHNNDGGGGGEENIETTMGQQRSHTPRRTSSDSYLEAAPSSSSQRDGDGADIAVPSPPLQPPDYASLRSNPDIGEDIEYQVYIFECIQSKTQRSIEKTYNGHASGFRDNFIATLREYFLLGSALNGLSLMPEYLIMRGKSLKSSLLVVSQWRDARKANMYGIKREVDPTNETWFGGFCMEPQPQQRSSIWASLSLLLNIVACFLYMMNYYIVGPSSVQYANALGEADAMSGLIVGALPWAALISAFIYSIWSNKSYRAPMIASGVLLIAGNALYSTAYRHQSIALALCGRFVTGLGAPRSMNRRFIADTTPLASRTAANAAFSTATALGAAFGPATAIVLDNFDFELDIPLYGTFYFNGLTGPGYVMSALWVIYLILLLFLFQEPVRSGLMEQVEKEEKNIVSSASTIQAIPTIKTYPSDYEMSNLSRVTNFERGDSAVTNFERIDYGSNTDVQEYCASAVDNRGSFDSVYEQSTYNDARGYSFCSQVKFVRKHMTPAVYICMFLLFSKQFCVENLISATAMLTKNRYGWGLKKVGALGTVVGCLTIPISIFIGWISQYREDWILMIWLISIATIGMGLLIDPTDLVTTDTDTYNEGDMFAVGPHRFYTGYVLVFCSIQAFDGVVGSVLSKVIPTALAAGTLNSGLLSTTVGTLGRAFGDLFITIVGYINLRQVQNLLFVPSFVILASTLILVVRKRETLTA